jgi:hypothetical protein
MSMETKFCRRCHKRYPGDEAHKCKQEQYKSDTIFEEIKVILCKKCGKEIDILQDTLNKGWCNECQNGRIKK